MRLLLALGFAGFAPRPAAYAAALSDCQAG